MLHKIEILGATFLILLGFILAIGYPDGGVKNKGNVISNKIVTIPTLTKEGNAKNFRVNNRKKNILPKTIQHETVSKKIVTTPKVVHNNKSKIIKTLKHKVKKVIKPPVPVKKKIKLAPPPPAAEEEEDEGC